MKNLDAIDKQMADELRAELASECSKPSDEWDLEKIRELSEVICEIEGIAPDSEELSSARKRAIDRINAEKPGIRHRKIKRFTAVAACLAVAFVGADLTSHRVLGQGVLPAGYQAVMGGIHTYFDGSDGTPDPHENIYYDIMKEKIDEYGLDVMIPTYIPEGFELDDIDCNSTRLRFMFSKINHVKTEKIIISYYSLNDENIGGFEIPSDTREVSEVEINSHHFNIIQEDQQLKAWCIEQNVITHFDSYDLPYEAADDILYSFDELA